MLIKDLLKLTHEKPLKDIAKDDLSIGREKARNALKKAGCYHQNGIKGWHCDDENILNQSIYDYVEGKQYKPRKNSPKGEFNGTPSLETSTNASVEKANESVKTSVTNVNVSENESAALVDSDLLAIIRTVTSNETAVASEDVIKSTKTSAGMDTIDLLLAQNDNKGTERVYKGFYWDKEVISFLDGIKHGNKSDLMNEIVKTVLRAKGLLW